MNEEFVQCPKDPRMKYRREVCESIFRKQNFRAWCQECQNFKPLEIQTEPA